MSLSGDQNDFTREKYTYALLQKSLKKVRSSDCNPLHAQQAIKSLVFVFFCGFFFPTDPL